MIEKGKGYTSEDFKFRLFCIASGMAGYLVFLDRFIPIKAIWNGNLCFLAGPFIFGALYDLEFFAISFLLMVTLGAADLMMGLDLNVSGGPSCWSGFAVWVMTIGAGFAGCVGSLFAPHKEFLFESHNSKINQFSLRRK